MSLEGPKFHTLWKRTGKKSFLKGRTYFEEEKFINGRRLVRSKREKEKHRKEKKRCPQCEARVSFKQKACHCGFDFYKGLVKTGKTRTSNSGYVYVEKVDRRTGKKSWTKLKGRVFEQTKTCPRCSSRAAIKVSLCQKCGFNFHIQDL